MPVIELAREPINTGGVGRETADRRRDGFVTEPAWMLWHTALVVAMLSIVSGVGR
jgi:hypothetical protein